MICLKHIGKAHKKTEHGRKAHGDMPVDERNEWLKKKAEKPQEKEVQKTKSRKKAEEFVAGRKKPSPANLTALINVGTRKFIKLLVKW